MDDLQGGTLALEHRYDLEKRAGDHALFSVYRGVQHPFQRPVWVKVCGAPAEHHAPALYDRLKRDVLRAADFRHPSVLEIVDFGDFDTHVPFVVTERAEGASLEEILADQGTLPLDDALRVVRQVAETLCDAHVQGRVHGGLAPRWVTVTDDGILLDHFGLQPTMAEIRALDDAILTSDLLWALPPEQFQDDERALDEASDVWAVAVLLYWLLSGVHPYFDDPTDTGDAVLRLRSLAAAPSLEELGVDATVAGVVEQALAPEREERFASMAELLDALPREAGAAQGTSSSEAPAESTPPPAELPRAAHEPPPLGTALAVAVALVLLTNLGWFFYHTATDSGSDEVETRAVSPAILPVGVQLRTVPEGARILRRGGGDGAELGDAPLTLDPKFGGGKLLLRVEKEGFEPLEIDVETGEQGQDLVVHLVPAEGAPAAEPVDAQ